MTELQLAIPVADALYFSGPVGPLMSYHYQLAVSNPVVSGSADIANMMNDHAKNNAEQLNQWARRYDEILDSMNHIGVAASLGSRGVSQ
ncbi:MAG: hypothetical protein K2Q25_11495 [Mycobacteriaceae bacterium]|nr:hypothetical protein [Mycobacteriaceae bacterium]